MNNDIARSEDYMPAVRNRKPISPGQHAILDYGVTAAFIAFGLLTRNRNARKLAFLNAGMVLGMSMVTNYPGGIVRKLSFRGHRRGDIVQAALAGLGPLLLGFGGTAAASYFYGQALSEVGVIAATDWDGVTNGAARARDYGEARGTRATAQL